LLRSSQRLSTMSPLWMTQCCQPATRERFMERHYYVSTTRIVEENRYSIFEPTLQILMNGIDFCGSYLLLAATGWFLRARVTENWMLIDFVPTVAMDDGWRN
jgi:hypothetical protein